MAGAGANPPGVLRLIAPSGAPLPYPRTQPKERRNPHEKRDLHFPQLPHQLLAVLPGAEEQRHERAGHRGRALRRAVQRAAGQPQRVLQGGQPGALRRGVPGRGLLHPQARARRLAGIQQRILAGAGRPAAHRLPHHLRLPGGRHPPDQVQVRNEGVLRKGGHSRGPLASGGRRAGLSGLHRAGGLARGGEAGQRRGGLRHPQAVQRGRAEAVPGAPGAGRPLYHGGVHPRRGQFLRRHHRL